MHTWHIDSPKFVWDKPVSSPPDYDAYELIHPDIFRKDSQTEYLNELDMSKYFYEDVSLRVGQSKRDEWKPELISVPRQRNVDKIG